MSWVPQRVLIGFLLLRGCRPFSILHFVLLLRSVVVPGVFAVSRDRCGLVRHTT